MKKRYIIIVLVLVIGFTFFKGFLNKKEKLDTVISQTPHTEENADVKEIMETMMQESVVEEEYLTPDSELTNAILYNMKVDILEDRGTQCKIRITYPDVGKALIQEAEKLPEDADEEDIADVYRRLTEAVNQNELSTEEETFVLDIRKEEDGTFYIDWTDEAMNAMTGGLYGIE